MYFPSIQKKVVLNVYIYVYIASKESGNKSFNGINFWPPLKLPRDQRLTRTSASPLEQVPTRDAELAESPASASI